MTAEVPFERARFSGRLPVAIAAPLHFGIGSMRQRAEIAGGWWRASSAPGAGTTVELWLPLRRDARAS